MKIGEYLRDGARKYNTEVKLALNALRYLPKELLNNRINAWSEYHTKPEPPKETFREWYKKENSKKD